MNSPASNDPEFEPTTTDTTPVSETTHATHTNHPDPITGEPDAHPVGVGVGALSAGAAGAAIGAFAGPIGVVIGAAIGAIAGGLAGKEVAETPEVTPVETEGGTLDEFDHASSATTSEREIPLSSSLAERTSPADDDFLTGGTVSGKDPERTTALDDFDRPRAATAAPAAVPVARPSTADEPLPTASSGLITPDESSFFADSTTGESSILAESPVPGAMAVTAEGDPAVSTQQPTYASHLDTEHLVRTAAYYRFLGRETTGQPGSEFEDWIKAEKEVLQG